MPLIDPVSWCDTPAAPLVAGEIELVLVLHHAPAALIPALAAILTPDERVVAGRYTAPAARERAVVSRAILRLLLAQHFGIAPQDLDIAADRHGKPLVDRPDATGRRLSFNVAHSGDLLLVGFSRDPVGVDIESVRAIPRLDAFARTVLGERERALHAALPEDRRLAHAYRIWVGKEALVKRSGEGIRRDFASFDLMEKDATFFIPQDGYIAAVAGQERAALRFRRIGDIGRLLGGQAHRSL